MKSLYNVVLFAVNPQTMQLPCYSLFTFAEDDQEALAGKVEYLKEQLPEKDGWRCHSVQCQVLSPSLIEEAHAVLQLNALLVSTCIDDMPPLVPDRVAAAEWLNLQGSEVAQPQGTTVEFSSQPKNTP